MKADKKTEAEVITIINGFIGAYTRHDVEGTLAFLTPDPDLLLIGTGVDEKIVGIEQARAQIERDYEQTDDISIKLEPLAISSAGPVACTGCASSLLGGASRSKRELNKGSGPILNYSLKA